MLFFFWITFEIDDLMTMRVFPSDRKSDSLIKLHLRTAESLLSPAVLLPDQFSPSRSCFVNENKAGEVP